jgi:threonine/homoserine/homoserine lactone efflux protein
MLSLLLQTVIISLSGVMAPGPVTAVTLGKGSTSPSAGAFIAVGHGIVEFPLMGLVYIGAGFLMSIVPVKAAVFVLGGGFLLFMGVGMLRSMNGAEVVASGGRGGPVAAGVLLSLWNPYFLLWWATVGAALITQAVKFGAAGFFLFAVVHWMCDAVWLTFLSAASYRGGKVFGVAFRRSVFLGCGIFLLLFGGKFLYDAVRLFVS